MKRSTQLAGCCLALFLLFSYLPTHVFAQNQVARVVTASNGDAVPFLQYTPAGHNVAGNTRRYPMIVFLHGAGEKSDDASLTYPTSPVWNLQGFGPCRQVAIGNKMNFTWAGVTDTFIVLSPMSRLHERLNPTQEIGIWKEAYINAVIKFARDSLKVDTSRIYLTGLSYGGGGTFRYISSDSNNTKKLAAAATVCAASHFILATGPTYVKNAHLPVWGFHALNDTTPYATPWSTYSAIDSINKTNPPVKALKTLWPDGGHYIWPRVYDIDTYQYGYDGILNIYEWFLGQNKSLAVNILPVARAGNDTTISRYSGVATLNGSASTDVDGTIVRYVWKKVSGPSGGAIATPLGTASSTTVSGLTTVGTYKYELNVVDNRAAIAKDTIIITVDSSAIGQGKALAITSTGRISTGDVTQLKNASQFTLEALFKYDSTVSTWTTLFVKSTALSDRIMLHVGPGDNAIYAMVCNGTDVNGHTATNTVAPGTWYHVAAVFDGTQTGNANRLKIYLNGVQQTLTYTGTIPANTSSTNTAAFRAGGEYSCCGLNGTIDEVRVWNTALSANTINDWKDKLLGSCHPNIANLAVYWPLDNSSNPSQASAALGTAYTGAITNGTYVISSRATDTACTGNAAAITSTGRISTGDVTELKSASKFTLETQFKYDSTVGTWTTLMCKSTSLTDRVMLHVGPSNNSIYVMVCNGSNSYGYTGANVVSPGTWYHVAAVFDGTQTGDANRLKLYIDGVQQTLTFPVPIPASTSSTNTAAFRAGGEYSCCGVNGSIDEVRVWSTALSGATIGAWKDKLLGSCHPNIGNLVLYWPLDNSSNASQAVAALGTAYTGTLTNSSYVSSAQATAASGCSGGSFAMTQPINALPSNLLSTSRIYPNPTDGLVTVELTAALSTPVRLNVVDMYGKYVYRNMKPVVTGNNRLSLNIASLPAGSYLIEISDGKQIMQRYKVVKL